MLTFARFIKILPSLELRVLRARLVLDPDASTALVRLEAILAIEEELRRR